jgi:ABC-type ATPase with predicted acetyltransferase domain
MPIWKCSQCGYEKSGPCRPKECPECKSPKESFLKAEESITKPKTKKVVKEKKTQKKKK